MNSQEIPQAIQPTIIVAGISSGAGKTSVAEAVTGWLAKRCNTAAAKITVTHGERGCPHGGKGCNVCSSLGGDFQIINNASIISQEGTDTARLLAAGGKPVLWAITRDVAIKDAWLSMQSFLAAADCAVIETNTLAEHIEPTLTLMIVDPGISRKIWKPSALRLIASADYLIFNDRRGEREKRDALLDEIRSLRRQRDGFIEVSHPHEVVSDSSLIKGLEETLSRMKIQPA